MFNSTKLKLKGDSYDDIIENSCPKKAHKNTWNWSCWSCDVSLNMLKGYIGFDFWSSFSDDTVHHVSKYNVDSRVRECDAISKDIATLTKLAARDLVAQEAIYNVYVAGFVLLKNVLENAIEAVHISCVTWIFRGKSGCTSLKLTIKMCRKISFLFWNMNLL